MHSRSRSTPIRTRTCIYVYTHTHTHTHVKSRARVSHDSRGRENKGEYNARAQEGDRRKMKNVDYESEWELVYAYVYIRIAYIPVLARIHTQTHIRSRITVRGCNAILCRPHVSGLRGCPAHACAYVRTDLGTDTYARAHTCMFMPCARHYVKLTNITLCSAVLRLSPFPSLGLFFFFIAGFFFVECMHRAPSGNYKRLTLTFHACARDD